MYACMHEYVCTYVRTYTHRGRRSHAQDADDVWRRPHPPRLRPLLIYHGLRPDAELPLQPSRTLPGDCPPLPEMPRSRADTRSTLELQLHSGRHCLGQHAPACLRASAIPATSMCGQAAPCAQAVGDGHSQPLLIAKSVGHRVDPRRGARRARQRDTASAEGCPGTGLKAPPSQLHTLLPYVRDRHRPAHSTSLCPH
jgi:hypothetical protein